MASALIPPFLRRPASSPRQRWPPDGPHYRNPITEEFNLGYSWAINNNSAVEAEYTHVLGIHENKTMNIDQRVPLNGVCCTAPLPPLSLKLD